jgi:hypothetical protein
MGMPVFDESGRLLQRPAEKDLDRQAGLVGGVDLDGLSPMLA